MAEILDLKANISEWEGPLREGNHAEISPLVYITKSAVTFLDKQTHEPNNGEDSELVKESQIELQEKLNKQRTERYILQSVARKAMPRERVSICLRNRRSKDIDIEVWRHETTRKAFYAGLQVCGSVWLCPVCAAKISERRKLELKTATEQFKTEEGKLAMLTLTFSHKANDELKSTVKSFLEAIRYFRSMRKYKDLMEFMESEGTIRSFEITYGSNGFHPHIHILIFYKYDVLLPVIEIQLFKLWKKACEKFGLKTKDKYGLTLQDGTNADTYVSKWGIEQEITKSHIKKGRKDNVTPFDFLRLYLETEDEKYLYLYEQYGYALKGKSQLFWSRGLKQRFNINELTDEELAEEQKEEADLLGEIPFYLWRKILRTDKRLEFLELCEKQSFHEAVEIINTFTNTNKKALQPNLIKGLDELNG